MNNRDTKELEILYEKSKAILTDFLLVKSTENFDWSKFWDHYILCEQNCYPLYESFEHIKTTNISDEYKVVATNGMEYEVSINYHPRYVLDNYLLSALLSKTCNKERVEQIKNVIDKTSAPIMNVNFRDAENNIHTTNKQGNYAFSVISGVKQAITHSLHSRGGIVPDVLYFLVKHGEDKKIELFKRAYRGLFGKLTEEYVDKEYSNHYSALYFFNNNI